METIVIQNFAGIKSLEITLSRINVFIGQQASGKSVTAKLIYFFKRIPREFLDWAVEKKTKPQVTRALIAKFEDYFPRDTWPLDSFEISYHFDSCYIVLSSVNSKISVEYGDSFISAFYYAKNLIKHDRNRKENDESINLYAPSVSVLERFLSAVDIQFGLGAGYNPIFIPAGRSFFANLQSSIFSLFSVSRTIDPFLVEFGSFYENIKSALTRSAVGKVRRHVTSIADQLEFDVLTGRYYREKNRDYLLHTDSRSINLSYASSGQQETLPLILVLRSLLQYSFVGNGTSVFIEEPEAHLFPATQRKMIELMALVLNKAMSNCQLVITTHSPYVLTSLNNLIQAGIILADSSESQKQRVFQIVREELIIESNYMHAFAFMDGGATPIMDSDTGLIYSDYLDSVSDDIAVQFDDLLAID